MDKEEFLNKMADLGQKLLDQDKLESKEQSSIFPMSKEDKTIVLNEIDNYSLHLAEKYIPYLEEAADYVIKMNKRLK